MTLGAIRYHVMVSWVSFLSICSFHSRLRSGTEQTDGQTD